MGRLSRKTTKDLGKKPKGDSVQIYKRLLSYGKYYLGAFAIAMLANILYSAVDSLFAYLLKPILNKGFVSPDPVFLKYIPITIILLFVFRAAMNLIGSYSMGLVARSIVMKFRQQLFAHFLHMPSSFFDKSSSGQLLAMLVYNAAQVSSACTDAVTTIIQSGALVIGLTVVMASISWQLTLVFFISIPFIAIVVKLCSKYLRVVSRNAQNSIADITHVAEEAIEGYRVVRTFSGEGYEIDKFNQVTKNNVNWELKAVIFKAINTSSVQLIGVSVLAVMIYLATQHLIGGEPLSAGGFTAVMAAMMGMLKPMRNLTSVSATIQKGLAGAESIFDVLDLAPEKDTGNIQLERVAGQVEFDNVSFSYNNAHQVLSNISFTVAPGEIVALVGHSGSGKSTLASLLTRFYDIQQGHIRIDEHDIFDIQLADLRKQFALVTQHVTLFNDTIANNIAYGMDIEKVSEKQIISAAESAYAKEFIDRLPEGIHTIVGENGVLLSGGQRQRLAIARAILKDAPILILDEATSALDTESERYIQAALEVVMKNRTTIVIAHRLSTIENADKIIVMEHGKMVESGKHIELLNDETSVYRKLYMMQFQEN
ncbi:MAG: lipid A export permease/ATP-binding protein MsbA [Legionellales bacterium]|nr:lipid A export permease/ATP-binding protein MsbA [Legionellales bacterium]